jgi:hypothetical protein
MEHDPIHAWFVLGNHSTTRVCGDPDNTATPATCAIPDGSSNVTCKKSLPTMWALVDMMVAVVVDPPGEGITVVLLGTGTVKYATRSSS